MTQSSQIRRLETQLEVEVRDLEEFLRPYHRLLEERKKQLRTLYSEREKAEKEEFIAENGVTSKKAGKPSGEKTKTSKDNESSLVKKFQAELGRMSEEEQSEFLKKHGLI